MLSPAFAAALSVPAAATAPLAPRPASRAVARLVLFIGEAMRPQPDVAALLARDGIRSLWLAGAEQALHCAELARFDAALLDSAAADGHASALIARLREALACPLVVVAEHADEIDEILALELGADLYLARPLAARRLRAHLAALMRRPAQSSAAAPEADRPHAAASNGWALDIELCCLLRGTQQVRLTDVQARLLQRLLAAPGRLVPRAELVAAMRHGPQLQARSIDVYMHRLRQRLREQAVDGLVIEVVRSRGYRLLAGMPA